MTEEGDRVFEHPLLKLQQQAEESRERREKERVHCPECDTEVLKDEVGDAIKAAEKHDEARHDGERTTRVNGMLPPSDEVADAARDAISQIAEDGNER